MERSELKHWGIKGMKWGVRRYQNKDGSLTPAGKKRYSDGSTSSSSTSKSSQTSQTSQQPKKKTVSEMSDQELRDAVNRLRLEQDYAKLNPEKVSRGKKFVDNLLDETLSGVARGAGSASAIAVTSLGKILGEQLEKAAREKMK